MNLSQLLTNFSQAKLYCSKEDTRVDGPWTIGDDTDIAEKQGERKDLQRIKRKIDAGESDEDLWADEFTTMVHNHRAFKVYKAVVSPKRTHEMEIITLIGDTGTGKTRWARETYPNAYKCPQKKGSGTYWDGYDDHDVVIIDEMYGHRFAYGFTLELIDSYSEFTVPIHGGQVNFRPHTIIFTSNAHPTEWYAGLKENGERKFPWIEGPLKRRLTEGMSRIYRVDMGGVLVLLEGEEPVVYGPINLI